MNFQGDDPIGTSLSALLSDIKPSKDLESPQNQDAAGESIQKRLENLKSACSQISKIACQLNMAFGATLLEDFAKWSSHLDVVFVGQYSSGKSSLLNAVLARDFLPTGFRPTTQNLWRLSFGNRQNIWIMNKDGVKTGERAPDALSDLSGSENSHGYYDAQILSDCLDVDRLVFWDTVGGNAPGSPSDPSSNNIIKEAEVLIWVTHPDLQAWDIEHLNKLCADASFAKIIVIMTYAPKSAVERERKLQRIQETITEHFDGCSDINFVAVENHDAQKAQASLKRISEDFQSQITAFLANRNNTILSRDWASAVNQTIDQIRASGVAEIRDMMIQINNQLDRLLLKSGSSRISKLSQQIENHLKDIISNLEQRLESLKSQQNSLSEIRKTQIRFKTPEECCSILRSRLTQHISKQINEASLQLHICWENCKQSSEKLGISGSIKRLVATKEEIITKRASKKVATDQQRILKKLRNGMSFSKLTAEWIPKETRDRIFETLVRLENPYRTLEPQLTQHLDNHYDSLGESINQHIISLSETYPVNEHHTYKTITNRDSISSILKDEKNIWIDFIDTKYITNFVALYKQSTEKINHALSQTLEQLSSSEWSNLAIDIESLTQEQSHNKLMLAQITEMSKISI